MFPLAFRGMTAAAAKATAARSIANTSKRLARLEARGLASESAVAELDALRSANPTTRNEQVALARRASKLDQSPTTRAATAEKAYRSEQQAIQRKQLLADSSDPTIRRSMSTEDLQQAYQLKRKSARDAGRRVSNDIGENFATKKLDKFLSETSKKPTRNQLVSYNAELDKIRKYEGLSVTGAKTQEQRGVDAFGALYSSMSDDEKAATWDAMKSEAKSRQVGTDEVIQMAVQYRKITSVEVDDGSGGMKTVEGTAVAFSQDKNGNTVASFGFNQDTADAKAAIRGANAIKLKEILDKGRPASDTLTM